MKPLFVPLYRIARPYGRRKLAVVFLFTLAQVITQLLAVISLLPFLSAAADISMFRQSHAGTILLMLIGDGSDKFIIVSAGLISLAIVVLGNVVTLAAEFVRARYAYGLGNWLRGHLLELISERRYEYFRSINSSVLMKNIIDDVSAFTQGTLMPVLDILARSSLALMLGLALVIIEPLVFLISLVVLGGYFLAIQPIRHGSSGLSAGILTNTKKLYFRVSQMLGGIKPILAADRQRHFIDRCLEASTGLARHASLVPVYNAIPRIGLEILVFGGLILWVLANLAAGQDMVALMPRVGLVAVIAYRLMPSLQLISSQTMAIASSRHAMDEIARIIAEQARYSSRGIDPGVPSGRQSAMEWHDALRFEDVSFTYAGADSPALNNISFAIAKGEHVAFVGQTGSGKSTLIDLILGLLEPTEGSILLDGKRVTPHTAPGWRRIVGYVPQDVFLYDVSVAENIAFGLGEDELNMDQVRRVSAVAHADNFIEQNETVGYTSQVGERGVRLSGGQRQRLALARALYDGPKVLVLDEATSALDPQTEKNVVATLSATHEKLTVITATHRLTTIRDYDRIYYLDHGQIVASGTFTELQQHPQFESFSR